MNPAAPATLVIVTNRAKGGAQMIAASFARYFHETGRLSGFLTIARSPSVFPDDVRSESLLGRLGRPAFYLLGLPLLAREIHRRRPRVVFSTLLVCNLLTILAARLAMGRRVTVVARETTVIGSRLRSEGRIKRLLLRTARHVYPMADVVIAPSEGVASDLREYLGLSQSQVRVLPNPTITPDFERRMKEPASHPYFEDGSGPVFVACGRLGPEKGYDVLLEAFFLLIPKLPNARLLILGEGSERQVLQAMAQRLKIEDRVDLAGHRDNPLPFIRMASVFVLSSRWEGLPNALIQALGCGTTSVSTDCPSGPREILEGGRYGYLTPVGDAPSLSDAMLRASQSPFSSDLLRSRAQDFSSGQIFARYDALIQELEERCSDR